MHRHFKKIGVYIFIFLLTSISSRAQLASKHYISPAWQVGGGIGEVYLVLSTFTSKGFFVKIEKGNGEIVDSVFISSSKPRTIELGKNSSSPFVGTDRHLNKPIRDKGLILSSSGTFFANIRTKSAPQGASLTSKGDQALGRDFYTGQLVEGYGPPVSVEQCGHFISVMATEDNTQIQFSNFKKGVSLMGREHDGNGKNPTVKDFSILLNAGESYIVGEKLLNMKAQDINKFYGINVKSNKPITVNCGSAHAMNPYSDNLYDIGFDQIEPVNLVGKEYVLTRGFGDDLMESPVIVATDNNTIVSIIGSADIEKTLNKGESYILEGADFNDIGNMYILSDKPIYVYQNISAGRCHCNQGFCYVPPLNKCGSMDDIILSNLKLISDKTALNIVSRPSNIVYVRDLKNNNILTTLDETFSNFSEYDTSKDIDWVIYKYNVPYNVTDVKISSEYPVSVCATFKSEAIGVSTYVVGMTPSPKIRNRNPQGKTLDFCKGDELVLLSSLKRDKYDFQWYNGVNKIEKARSNTYKVKEPGEYILSVKDLSCNQEFRSGEYFVKKCFKEEELEVAVAKTFNNEYHGDTTHLLTDKADEEIVALHDEHKMLSREDVIKSIESMLSQHQVDSALSLLELSFISNSDELDETSQLFFRELVKDLGYYEEDIEVHIIAHTDCIGSSAYNQKLSDKRAEHIAEYFLEHGFHETNISSEGKGESLPLIHCDCDGSASGNIQCNEELLAVNRRLELQITQRR